VTFRTEPVRFPSGNGECAGDLYRPEADDPGIPVPVVVMAHGIAAYREFGLAPFAEAFAARGLAVLVFDYRSMGGSPGEPRCLVSPRRHVEDYLSALAFVRADPRFDPDRIGLWGTSFSGGHVLVAAARSPEGIRAVVSQIPFVSGTTSLLIYPPRYHLPALLLGMWDGLKGLLGLRPATVAVVRERGLALLAAPDSYEGYLAMVPGDSDWSGRVPARGLLSAIMYHPIRHAKRVRAPTLMMLAEKDSLCPPAASRRAAWRIPDCRLEEFPIGHFDPYREEWLDRFLAIQGDFLEERLTG